MNTSENKAMNRRSFLPSVLLLLSLAIGPLAQCDDPGASETATTHRFIAFGQKTYLVDGSGEKTWTYPHATRDGYMLESGNIVLTLNKSKRYAGDTVIEITPDGKETLIRKGTQSEVNSAQPTDAGTFVITEAGENPRLIEVDRSGKIIVEFPLVCQKGESSPANSHGPQAI